MKRKICAAVAVMSFIWLLGTAGASDCDSITFTQATLQAIAALTTFTVSIWIGGFTK